MDTIKILDSQYLADQLLAHKLHEVLPELEVEYSSEYLDIIIELEKQLRRFGNKDFCFEQMIDLLDFNMGEEMSEETREELEYFFNQTY